jgi:hypothetical protein
MTAFSASRWNWSQTVSVTGSGAVAGADVGTAVAPQPAISTAIKTSDANFHAYVFMSLLLN